MRRLALEEIVGIDAYDGLRKAYREAVIAHKHHRRVAVGEKVTLVFEDRETLRFQVQEMLWIERITEPRKIQAELDVYNELMPAERELSATLFVEIEEPTEIRPELDRLVGIDEHVSLVLGDGGDEESIPARFDPEQMEDERISAVQYLKFPFSEAQVARFAESKVRALLRIDHPSYRHQCEISPRAREQLLRDLSSEPEPLLGLGPRPAPRAGADRPARGRVRVRQERPDLIVVEPVEPVSSLLDADPALLAELMQGVQQAAREILRDSPGCRVETEIGGGSNRLRWHVYAD